MTDDDDAPRWVIHLPTTLTDLDATIRLTHALRASLTHVDVLDFGEVTLSEEDDQRRHRYVYCNLSLGAGHRCARPDGHGGTCHAAPAP